MLISKLFKYFCYYYKIHLILDIHLASNRIYKIKAINTMGRSTSWHPCLKGHHTNINSNYFDIICRIHEHEYLCFYMFHKLLTEICLHFLKKLLEMFRSSTLSKCLITNCYALCLWRVNDFYQGRLMLFNPWEMKIYCDHFYNVI